MNKISKILTLGLVCSVVVSISAMDGKQNNLTELKATQGRKKRKRNDIEQNNAKRVKVTPKQEEEFVDDGVCPDCGVQWLAQTDECPGCFRSTTLGDDYEVINHKYFVPKDNK